MVVPSRVVFLLLLLGLPGLAAAAAGSAAPRVLHDVAYGSNPLQRYDVYLPAHAHDAPVIFMVHGGGWRRGDKAAQGVVNNKVARWVSQGFVLVSANYRLLPVSVDNQVDDVARALASAQQHAKAWGADPGKFILMGHSAGAHLVALLDADPSRAKQLGAKPWLGVVSLDSAVVDLQAKMQGKHFKLYDNAFGDTPSTWSRLSPLAQLRADAPPLLLVCSTQRRDSCPAARKFAGKARHMDVRAEVLGEDLRHGEINSLLGEPSDYTRAVERFMASLDPGVARRLRSG